MSPSLPLCSSVDPLLSSMTSAHGEKLFASAPKLFKLPLNVLMSCLLQGLDSASQVGISQPHCGVRDPPPEVNKKRIRDPKEPLRQRSEAASISPSSPYGTSDCCLEPLLSAPSSPRQHPYFQSSGHSMSPSCRKLSKKAFSIFSGTGLGTRCSGPL